MQAMLPFDLPFENVGWLSYIGQIIDILLVTYVIYKLIMIIRGTRAVQLVKGITVILIVWFISGFFGLRTLEFIMSQTLTYGLLAIIIIFQPELRRGLEQLGRGRFLRVEPLLKMNLYKNQLMPSLNHVHTWVNAELERLFQLNEKQD